MELTEYNQFLSHLKNKTEKGFQELSRLYGGKIFNLAYKILGNKEDASDIVQETFFQVYQNIDKFKGDSHIFTWIYSIAKNLSFRKIQNKKKNSFSDLENLIGTVNETSEKNEYSRIEKQFYIEQVKEGCLLGLLRCLSLYQRTAFVFNILLEVPVRDLAAILGKTESSTRTLVHRARMNIKAFLCKNCSLYNQSNPCKCENLIDFSLKKGWISEYHDQNYDKITHELENEIKEYKKVLLLYHSIPEKSLPSGLIQKIHKSLIQKNSLVFSGSKVK